jgi:ribonuclease D
VIAHEGIRGKGGGIGGLEINAEVLATRRELEKLAAGRQDISLLRGWRKDVVGDRLLAAL